MTGDWTAPGWAVLAGLTVLVLLCGTLAGLLLGSRRRTRAAVATALAENAALRHEVQELARRLDQRPAGEPHRPGDDAAPYLITAVGAVADPAPAAGSGDPAVPARLPGPLFADLVLRESVVQAASLLHGVRRALSPEVRHRIRFEMRREVKRSRRQRRAELRQLRRTWHAEQRAAMAGHDAETAS